MPCGGLFNPDKSKYPIFLPVLFPYTRRYPARRFESRSGYKTGTRQDCHSDPRIDSAIAAFSSELFRAVDQAPADIFSAAIAIHLQIKQVHILEHCFLQNRYADALSVLVCTEECRIRHFFQLIMLIRKAHFAPFLRRKLDFPAAPSPIPVFQNHPSKNQKGLVGKIGVGRMRRIDHFDFNHAAPEKRAMRFSRTALQNYLLSAFFASSASAANAVGSEIASSASILRLISTPATFRPFIRRE